MMAHSISPIHFNGLQDICERYRATKDKASSYYAQGFKRCQMCELFIKWGGAKCPCCERADDKAAR